MQRLGAVVVVIGALASPRSADACHTGTAIGIVLFGVAEVGLNTPLTIHNLVVSESSRGYGIAETVVSAPSLLVGGLLAQHTFTTCDESGQQYPVATRGEQVFTLSMVGWSAALLAHGIYTIARPRVDRSAPPAVMPVPISSDQGELLGVGLAGRF